VNIENNKRLAKNTLVLYGRMLLTMVVSLYTSRVVLAALGVENFGIYNIVGGVVVLFSFLNSAMSSATERFLNFEIGRNNPKIVQRVFSVSLTVHSAVTLVVLILAETVGLWFLNARLNIPIGRMSAANWVYQFSVGATLLGILRVPFNAAIIAYEQMSFYAYLSVVEIFLKLGVVYLLVLSSLDTLILYAGLIFGIGIVMLVAYASFCLWSFPTTKVRLSYDRNMLQAMSGFSGWSLLGGIAVICNTQGINMVLNLFCGVAVNAAMGIANQVNGAIYQFVTNFQTAFSPQIVKYYAAGKQDELFCLVFRASTISFLLMALLSLPILSNSAFILALWLNKVPPYASEFTCVIIGCCLIDCLSLPIYALVNATGRIRAYQFLISILFILNIPVAYAMLCAEYSPVSVLISRLCISLLLFPVRIVIARQRANLSIADYFNHVFGKVIVIFLAAYIPSLSIAGSLSGWSAFLASSAYSTAVVCSGGWFWAFSRWERHAIVGILMQKSAC